MKTHRRFGRFSSQSILSFFIVSRRCNLCPRGYMQENIAFSLYVPEGALSCYGYPDLLVDGPWRFNWVVVRTGRTSGFGTGFVSDLVRHREAGHHQSTFIKPAAGLAFRETEVAEYFKRCCIILNTQKLLHVGYWH